MPTPTQAFLDVAARHGKVDPADAETVQHWFTEVLPTLPQREIAEILEELLAHNGTHAAGPVVRSYPKNVSLPSLEDSPPVISSGWKQLLSTLMAKIRGPSTPNS